MNKYNIEELFESAWIEDIIEEYAGLEGLDRDKFAKVAEEITEINRQIMCDYLDQTEGIWNLKT